VRPASSRVTVGNYTYMDSDLHVKLSLAADAIIRGLCERQDTAIAFLCTPTDVHLITESAHKAASENYKNAPFLYKLLERVTGQLEKNVLPPVKANGKEFCLVDGIVVPQGPNYALAKRMQHWRAMVASSNNVAVSSNVAPSTATKSVVHNKQFAAAYQGFRNFPPMEIMYQETSNAVMAALLIYDIKSPNSPANPAKHLDNPMELFTIGAFHGGVWRTAYTINSFGTFAAVFYYLTHFRNELLVVVLSAVSFFAYCCVQPPHTWSMF